MHAKRGVSETIALASERGWLVIKPGLPEAAITEWQHLCARFAWPFVLVREEGTRVTVWFVLAANREWTPAEREVLGTLAATHRALAITPNSARWFTSPGAETAPLRALLALGRH